MIINGVRFVPMLGNQDVIKARLDGRKENECGCR